MLTRQREKTGKMVKNNGVKDSKDSQTGSDPAGACTAEARSRENEILDEIRALRQEHTKAVNDHGKMLKQMETDIKSVSEQMTKLETRTTAAEVRLGETEDRTTRLEKAVILLLEQGATLAAKCESLEARSRRKNVRIHRITEGAEKNDVIAFVKEFICNSLKLPTDLDLQIERAHRIPTHIVKESGARPRAIIVRFLHFQVKELVMTHAWRLKPAYEGHPVYFNEDYTAETMKKRRQVRDVIKQLKDRNIRAQSPYPARLKIFMDGGAKSFPSLAAAAPVLRDLGIHVKEEDMETLKGELVKGMWNVVTDRRDCIKTAEDK